MPKVWQPLEPGREIRLWRGRHHVMGGCYILTANMAAGRFLPRGFAVCELVDGAGSSLMTETDYWKVIGEALNHYKTFIGDLDEMSFYDGEGDAKQALEGIDATIIFARDKRRTAEANEQRNKETR